MTERNIEFYDFYRELEKAEPFTRKIHEDELWLYRNPRTESFVPTTILWVYIFREFSISKIPRCNLYLIIFFLFSLLYL